MASNADVPQSDEARELDIDNAVERWHLNPDGEANQPLHEYLGWTWDEYAAYVMRNELPAPRTGAI